MNSSERKILREMKKSLEVHLTALEEIKDGISYRVDEAEEKSPDSERTERLTSELDKIEEVFDSFETYINELEELETGDF